MIFMVPVQFFQSVIAVELAIVGALLWQIRFFDKEDTQAETSRRDPRLQLLLLVVLTAILFGSLEALREVVVRWPRSCLPWVSQYRYCRSCCVCCGPFDATRPCNRGIRSCGLPCSACSFSPPLWFFSYSSADHVRRRSVGCRQALP